MSADFIIKIVENSLSVAVLLIVGFHIWKQLTAQVNEKDKALKEQYNQLLEITMQYVGTLKDFQGMLQKSLEKSNDFSVGVKESQDKTIERLDQLYHKMQELGNKIGHVK